ncbi:MAG TPA: DUF1064 domain-containing protein [Chitinophagaceae bacterium]
MNKQWTQADIDKLQEKGIRQINTLPKVKELVKPVSFALGRLKAGNMNKTEAAYSQHLQNLQKSGEVIWFEFEPINLKLADKCFYRVDFLVMTKTRHLECHEVKGFWTDDALVKIKTAAAKFPFRFISVKLVKGQWEVREF